MSELIGTYGHGTENDFVVIFDPEDKRNLQVVRPLRSVIVRAVLAPMV